MKLWRFLLVFLVGCSRCVEDPGPATQEPAVVTSGGSIPPMSDTSTKIVGKPRQIKQLRGMNGTNPVNPPVAGDL